MAVFAYRAQNQQYTVVRGTVTADTPRQARDLLRDRGLAVEEIAVYNQRKTSWNLPLPGGSHSSKLVTATRELATLLSVGIPLVEALDTISKQYNGGFRNSLLVIKDRVTAGANLAEAMAEQPQIYDPLCLHMVEVGENAGNLDDVLERLAEFKEQSLHLKDRVLTALLYPVIVLFSSIGVTIFLMTVVVPMLLTNLIEAGKALPWPTRVLKAMSDLLLGHGWWLAILAVLCAIGLGTAMQTTSGRRVWHRWLLKMPLMGPLAQKQTLGRMATIVATLLRSGIVLLRAMDIAARSTSNVIVREAIEQASTEVGAGQDMGLALERTGIFPPLFVQIFTVGQQTGRLEEMLERLAKDYDRQVNTMSTRLASALEPILILTLAVFVGFILFATILPILEAGNVL